MDSNEDERKMSDALARTIVEERRSLVGFFRGRLAGAADAEDLAQETGCRALEAAREGRYREKGQPRGFLYGIARRVLAGVRRKGAGAVAIPLEAEIESVVDEGASVEALLLEREGSERLGAAIAALPETLRRPIELLLDEELPLAGIAVRLGTSEAAVKVRIHRAKLQLREALAAEGTTSPTGRRKP